MSLRWIRRTPVCALLAGLCALAISGCASWQLPRIDPTGEKIFIMPGEPQPTYTGPVAPGALQPPPALPPGTVAAPPAIVTSPATVPPPPPPPPPTVGMPQGNLQAAPVMPDSGLAPTPSTTVAAPSVPPPGTPAISLPPPTPISPAVDAQWAIPASTTAEGGRALVLTTIVSRRSDGAPLAGWVVRYEVTGAAATVGQTGGSYIDVATDAGGRASVEVSPSDVIGGTAIVNIALLPPTPQGGTAVELARGSAQITWTPAPASAPISVPPPPETTSPAASPIQPSWPNDRRPTLPTDTPSAERYSQPPARDATPDRTFAAPPPEKPVGTPRLEVTIRTTSPEPANVGDYARFEVTVTNRGDGLARGIKVLDRFDRGLEHSRAQPNELAVKYENMRDLPAGEFDTVPLTFKVVSAGRLCHHVTVTAEGAVQATASGCITAVAPAPVAAPTLEVTKQGPVRQYVGEVARFKTIIKNSGQVPVTNLEIVDQYDAALDPLPEAGAEELSRGRLRWRIDRMEVGERREFNVQCACQTEALPACTIVTVKGDGGVNYADQKCVEIMQQLSSGGGPSLAQPRAAGGLNVSIVASASPARVGAPLTVYIFIENLGTVAERDVRLRVSVPQEMTPLEMQIRPAGEFKIVGDREIQFTAIADLPPGEKRQFEVPVRVDRAATAYVWAQIAAAGMAQPITQQSKPIEILPAGN